MRFRYTIIRRERSRQEHHNGRLVNQLNPCSLYRVSNQQTCIRTDMRSKQLRLACSRALSHRLGLPRKPWQLNKRSPKSINHTKQARVIFGAYRPRQPFQYHFLFLYVYNEWNLSGWRQVVAELLVFTRKRTDNWQTDARTRPYGRRPFPSLDEDYTLAPEWDIMNEVKNRGKRGDEKMKIKKGGGWPTTSVDRNIESSTSSWRWL